MLYSSINRMAIGDVYTQLFDLLWEQTGEQRGWTNPHVEHTMTEDEEARYWLRLRLEAARRPFSPEPVFTTPILENTSPIPVPAPLATRLHVNTLLERIGTPPYQWTDDQNEEMGDVFDGE